MTVDPNALRLDPDARAVELARAGYRDAFQELAKRHHPGLLRLAGRYVKNAADAEEIAQHAWIRAFENIATFRGESTFRSWLYRIATHLALNHVRGLRVRESDDSVELEDIASFTHSLDTSRLVAREMWETIEKRLTELPPMQRLALELRAFHELSFGEIGIIADCSEDSAKMNYHHAVKRMREILAARAK